MQDTPSQFITDIPPAPRYGRWILLACAFIAGLAALLFLVILREKPATFTLPPVPVSLMITCNEQPPEQPSTISSPEQIQRCIEFMKAHADGWIAPGRPFPRPKYNVAFTDSIGAAQSFLFISPDGGEAWISFQHYSAGEKDPIYRRLPAEDRAALLKILSLPNPR